MLEVRRHMPQQLNKIQPLLYIWQFNFPHLYILTKLHANRFIGYIQTFNIQNLTFTSSKFLISLLKILAANCKDPIRSD